MHKNVKIKLSVIVSGPTSLTPQRDLHQSCRHLVRSWGNQSFGSHMHNMTLSNGRLRIPQTGRYYLYAQIYFRYLTLSNGEHQSSSESQQVVQCVYKKTAYVQPIQLLKEWAPSAGLRTVRMHFTLFTREVCLNCEQEMRSLSQCLLLLQCMQKTRPVTLEPFASTSEHCSFGCLWSVQCVDCENKERSGWTKEGSVKLPVYSETSMKGGHTIQQTNGVQKVM